MASSSMSKCWTAICLQMSLIVRPVVVPDQMLASTGGERTGRAASRTTWVSAVSMSTSSMTRWARV